MTNETQLSDIVSLIEQLFPVIEQVDRQIFRVTRNQYIHHVNTVANEEYYSWPLWRIGGMLFRHFVCAMRRNVGTFQRNRQQQPTTTNNNSNNTNDPKPARRRVGPHLEASRE